MSEPPEQSTKTKINKKKPCALKISTAKKIKRKPSKLKTDEKLIDYHIEALPHSYAFLGEGPHWDAETQSLYLVDIECGRLLRYDYAENKMYNTKIQGETQASFIVPIEGQPTHFAVGCGRRVVIVCWDGKEPICCVIEVLFDVEQKDDKYRGNRFNDGKCDPRGRLFAGTMRFIGDEFAHRFGQLYRYDKGLVDVIHWNIGVSNGLAWNESINKFYFIDTSDYQVKAYDYNIDMGVPSNPKVVWDLRKGKSSKNHLVPDGMTIDTNGNLYVCTFNGFTIYKIKPSTGEILQEIKFPIKQVTSCCFGGPKLDILFVTSAAKNGQLEPAGTTYKVTGLCAQGYPGVKLKLAE